MKLIPILLLLSLGTGAPATGQWSIEALSEGRSHPAAVSLGSKVIFAGGYDDCAQHSASSVVDVYDDMAGTWSTATLSQPRVGLSATTIGGKALFAGGDGSDVVDIYDDATGTWSTTSLSEARSSPTAVTVDGRALFAGGGYGLGASAVVDVYDDATGTWSMTSLSAARGSSAGVSVGTKAIFAGGSGCFCCFNNCPGSTDAVDIYDDSTGTWSTATLSQARFEIGAVTVGTKAIFAGGVSLALGAGSYSDAVDIYDDSTGIWSTAILSQARGAVGATTIGTKAIFAGGATIDGVGGSYPSDVIDIYDESTGTWSTAMLSQPRSGIAAVTLGGRAIFAGGLGAGNVPSDVVDIYDGSTGAWTTATLSQVRAGLSAITVGAKAMFAGGDAGGVCSDVVDIYDDAGVSFYCTAGVSASGCQATLGTVGTPSATAPSGFSAQASTVEGAKDGLFFFGSNGRQANPWGNGTSFQCVVPPVKRGGILTGVGTPGACDGSFSQDLNALWCPTCPQPGHNPGAGAAVQAQLWYRDPQNTSNQTTSLSDAIEFLVTP